MSTVNTSKINLLLKTQPKGTILLSSWLVGKGYSFDLQRRYRQSQWLTSIGAGAMVRSGDQVDLFGALYALQTQTGSTIHIGGKTALSMQGQSHYLEFSTKKAILFGSKEDKLPAWFTGYDWGIKVGYHATVFLQTKVGFTDIDVKAFKVKVSSAARAIMECLYLCPDKQDLLECYQLFESLNNLKPSLVQQLLENCTSVKVKRLFLYMADKAKHSWFDYLDLETIDLGRGKRSLVKNGTYVAKYKITVPKTIEDYDRSLL
jgi:transcriptional regulator with AbiEi antitoxin domain of type IV toxin-antitoxin system